MGRQELAVESTKDPGRQEDRKEKEICRPFWFGTAWKEVLLQGSLAKREGQRVASQLL